MWGQICTESSYQLNFNFGFSSYKSDILLHLSQWQYWWWFWFSFFWTFYYFLILRTIKNRTTKMNPKMNTSLRGRGKWGDFLIAVLPLSWCANILLNSNFILRMFEWQNESSLFTVRIHGKQWYWVYKFDLIDAIDILTVPKNVGNNRWIVGTPEELIVCESYLQAIQLRSQEDWIKNYWHKKIQDDLKTFKLIEISNMTNNINVNFEKQSLLNFNENYESKFDFLNKQVAANNLASKIKNPKNFYTNFNLNNFVINKKNSYLDIENFFSFYGFNYISDKKKTSEINIEHDFYFDNESNLALNDQLYTRASILGDTLYDQISATNKINWIENFKSNLFDVNKLKTFIFMDINNWFSLWRLLKSYPEKLFELKINKSIISFKNYYFKNNVYNTEFFDISHFYDDEGFFNINFFGELDYDNLYYNNDELDDTWDVDYNMRHEVNPGALKIVKHLLTPEYFKNNTDILKFNFYDNNNQTSPKVADNSNFWVLKQKRYKKKQIINVSSTKDVEYMSFDVVRNIYRKHIMENIKLVTDLDFQMDSYTLFKCVRNNKHRTESLPIHLYRRLLRTKKTLVLPAHINMTVVTNSYDVVHSWFLPGLGIKMDCVPGRSTHHSLYLDNIGFYYGQCAEICGRYHHHMPIRLCALPFEHFLVWWQLKGLPKLLRIKKNKNLIINHSVMKYTW